MANKLKRTLIGAAATATLLATPLAALAVPLFSIELVGIGICADGAGCDLNAAPNQITIVAGAGGFPTVPGFTGSIDTALTNSPGGPSFSVLDLNWTLSSIPSGAGGTVTIRASATDYTFPASGTPTMLTSSIGGTNLGTASVTAQQWVNLSNTLFGMGPITPGVQGPFTSTSFADDAAVQFISSTPYSITEELVITLGANSLSTGDFQSVVMPEPASLLLFATGLLGIGALARRRRSPAR